MIPISYFAQKNFTEIFTSIRFGVLLFGISGNILTFAIFSRKIFAKNSINIYARSIALFDSFIIIRLVNDAVVLFFGIDLSIHYSFQCKAMIYIAVGVLSIPAWILVAFSLDKMLCVLQHKHRFGLLKKKQFQLAVVAILASIHCLLFLEIPIYLEIRQVNNGTKKICSPANIPFWYVINTGSMFISVLIPFGILMVTTLVTFMTLFKSSRRMKSSIRTRVRTRCRRVSKDKNYAVNSIACSLTFVLLKMPLIFNHFYALTTNPILKKNMFEFTLILLYANNSIGFLVNFATNSIFRNEIYKIVFCKVRSRQVLI